MNQRPPPIDVVLEAIHLPAVAFKGTDWRQSQAICAGILGTALAEAAEAAATSDETVAQAYSPLLVGVGTVVGTGIEVLAVTDDGVAL